MKRRKFMQCVLAVTGAAVSVTMIAKAPKAKDLPVVEEPDGPFYYLSLHTTSEADSELDYGGYERQRITAEQPFDVDFPEWVGSGQAVVTFFGIWDVPVGGNLLHVEQVQLSRRFSLGATPIVKGSLSFLGAA